MSALPQDSSAESQRARILNRLRRGPATTLQLRHEIDVLMPAARVHELRHRHGFDIFTEMVSTETQPGKRHRVAMYALLGEAKP